MKLLVQQRQVPSLAASRSSRHVQARVAGNGASPVCQLKEGVRVRVTAPVKVFHVGKFKSGLDLQGMEGVVQADVSQYKGLTLSANLPWKVQFQAPGPEGKPVKVIAHLVSGAPAVPFVAAAWGA